MMVFIEMKVTQNSIQCGALIQTQKIILQPVPPPTYRSPPSPRPEPRPSFYHTTSFSDCFPRWVPLPELYPPLPSAPGSAFQNTSGQILLSEVAESSHFKSLIDKKESQIISLLPICCCLKQIDILAGFYISKYLFSLICLRMSDREACKCAGHSR